MVGMLSYDVLMPQSQIMEDPECLRLRSERAKIAVLVMLPTIFGECEVGLGACRASVMEMRAPSWLSMRRVPRCSRYWRRSQMLRSV